MRRVILASLAPATAILLLLGASVPAASAAGDVCGSGSAAQYCPTPVVVTAAASTITATSATLNGTVNPGGVATTCDFEYGTTTAYGTTTSAASYGSGSSVVTVAVPVTDLAAGTTYHVQLFCSNAGVTNTGGGDLTFTTPTTSGSRPALVTYGATLITTTTATFVGAVNPEGSTTVCEFLYGTTTAYGAHTTPASYGSGSTGVTVTAPATGLTPGTTYHIQLICGNAGGLGYGGDRPFTTVGLSKTPVRSKPRFSHKRTVYVGPSRIAAITFTCHRAACKGTLTLRSGKTKLASKSYSVKLNHTTTVKLKLSVKYFKKLKAHHKEKVTATALDKDKGTSSAGFTLRYRKPKKTKKTKK